MSKKSLWISLVVLVALGAGGFYYWKSTTPGSMGMKRPVVIGIVKYIPLLDPIEVGFKEQMKTLGYVEGKDVIYIEETSNGNPDLSKLNAIVKDEIAKGATLLYTFPVESSVAAFQETKAEGRIDIPIVAAATNAPIEWHLIKSYQSSGNNVAGIAIDISNETGKQLDFLRRVAPNAKKIAVFTAPVQNLTGTLTYESLLKQAPSLGFEIVSIQIKTPPGPNLVQGLTQELAAYKKGDFDAWFEVPSGAYSSPQAALPFIQMANRIGIPSFVLSDVKIQEGGLISYVYNFKAIGQQSTEIVDKIIKGTAPSDIPFDFPQKSDLVLSQITAQKIGITIPDSLLSIADKVYK